ncbi:hypothetical protein MSMTP_1745 [Methanosarcina sp. MTP4]|uniref:hypothetical protein n=1 Tax=Methanosarcina sp. MTP4 TaxID=1434100 RepID=UPI000615B7A0|nr:hypothetical protein [Methanosarcina sp. MTP4]AKB25214.1 hypothetical protein MSMTP_1745 [Methanosarcina sp. MTP4]
MYFQSDFGNSLWVSLAKSNHIEVLKILYDVSYEEGLFRNRDIISRFERGHREETFGDLNAVIDNLYGLNLAVPIYYPVSSNLKDDSRVHRFFKAVEISFLGKKLIKKLYKFSELNQEIELKEFCTALYDNRGNKKEFVECSRAYRKKSGSALEQALGHFNFPDGFGSISRTIEQKADYSLHFIMSGDFREKRAQNPKRVNLNSMSPESIGNIRDALQGINPYTKPLLASVIMNSFFQEKTRQRAVCAGTGYEEDPGKFYETLRKGFQSGVLALVYEDGEEFLELTPMGVCLVSLLRDIESRRTCPWYGSISKELGFLLTVKLTDLEERRKLIEKLIQVECGEGIASYERGWKNGLQDKGGQNGEYQDGWVQEGRYTDRRGKDKKGKDKGERNIKEQNKGELEVYFNCFGLIKDLEIGDIEVRELIQKKYGYGAVLDLNLICDREGGCSMESRGERIQLLEKVMYRPGKFLAPLEIRPKEETGKQRRCVVEAKYEVFKNLN